MMNLILFRQEECIPRKNESSISISIPISDERAEHLLTILRADEGCRFDAGIINGRIGKAVIKTIKEPLMHITFFPEYYPPGLLPIVLIVGLSRPQTIKKILKEATAMGVAGFILTGTEKGEKGYSESSVLKKSTINRLLLEGAQQAFCTMIPEITIKNSIKEALEEAAELRKNSRLISLDNYEAAVSLSEYWKNNKPADNEQTRTILAVGSERGWSGGERKAFKAAGFTLTSLGCRVLRTETAAIAGTAICLSGMGII
jgi:RsmE family RNA methyltransferase